MLGFVSSSCVPPDGGFRAVYDEFFEDTRDADIAVADAVRELRAAVEAAAIHDRMPWEHHVTRSHDEPADGKTEVTGVCLCVCVCVRVRVCGLLWTCVCRAVAVKVKQLLWKRHLLMRTLLRMLLAGVLSWVGCAKPMRQLMLGVLSGTLVTLA
jgi:hypothetical protein